MDRKKIAELAKNRLGKARQPQEKPARTGAQVLKVILDEEDQKPESQIILYLKDGLNGASNNWTKYPNEIHDIIVDRLDPFEALLYLRLWRDSWGYNRNYCRHSHSKTMTHTCIKSIGTARRALDGLIKKRFLVRALRPDDGKQDIDKTGTLYRILTPNEILNNVTEEGVSLENIPEDGVICEIMISEIMGKKRNRKSNTKTMISEINDPNDHDHSDHDQIDQVTMINEIMIGEIIEEENKDETKASAHYDHTDHDYTDHPLKDNKDNLKDTLSLHNIVDLFYTKIGQNKISKEKRERAKKNLEELIDDGFSLQDIQFAVEWTLKNSKEKPYDFSIVKHTIGQAMAAKKDLEAKQARKAEEEREATRRQEEEARNLEERERVIAYKEALSEDERVKLRERAEDEIRSSGQYKEEFITDLLVDAMENSIIKEQIGIKLSKQE